MKNVFLGSSPATTIAGFVLAGLYAFQASFKPEMKWYDWAVPVAIAIFGRMVAGESTEE